LRAPWTFTAITDADWSVVSTEIPTHKPDALKEAELLAFVAYSKSVFGEDVKDFEGQSG
jgi:hypothetical protein